MGWLPPREPVPGGNPLLKRLPILVLIAAGVMLYQSSLFPQSRTLVWQTGASRAEIEQVDLQLWRGTELLKREVKRFGAGAPAEVTQEVTLSEGAYEARYVIDRVGRTQEAGTRPLQVDGEQTYYLPLGRN